jgi:hypothetical protein
VIKKSNYATFLLHSKDVEDSPPYQIDLDLNQTSLVYHKDIWIWMSNITVLTNTKISNYFIQLNDIVLIIMTFITAHHLVIHKQPLCQAFFNVKCDEIHWPVTMTLAIWPQCNSYLTICQFFQLAVKKFYPDKYLMVH